MEDEKTYIKGFNSGYKLSQFTPELWEKLKPSLSKANEYEKGLIEGAEEFLRTKEKDRFEELGSIRKQKDNRVDRDISRT